MAAERLPPPTMTIGPHAWLRTNLFNSWANSLITVLLAGFLVVATVLIVDWAVTDARWGVVTSNLRLFLIGQYPLDEAWRVWLALLLMSVLAGSSVAVYGGGTIRALANGLAVGQGMLGVLAAVSDMGPVFAGGLIVNAAVVWIAQAGTVRLPISRRGLSIAWLALLPVAFVLLQGSGLPLLPLVPTHLWGGLLLTFLLAIAGIVVSFPFGVLLALGRRSALPAVRVLSTIYIEVVRGVPLVTILFMAAIMLPLFLPGGVRIEHVFRAVAGITLFSAAYVAENVRGGLQAIPEGQIEAANAIGLNALQRNLYIVLPQALRAVIPANVGLFISLLKDTTLVAIAGTGLLELLGIGRVVVAQPQWIGAQLEVYIFISAVFFFLSYMMSQASYRLEAAMGVGTR